MNYRETVQFENRYNREVAIYKHLNKIIPELIKYFEAGNFRILTDGSLSKKDKENIKNICGDYPYLYSIGFHYFNIKYSYGNIIVEYSYNWKVSDWGVYYNNSNIYIYDVNNVKAYEFKSLEVSTVKQREDKLKEYKEIKEEIRNLDNKLYNLKIELGL